MAGRGQRVSFRSFRIAIVLRVEAAVLKHKVLNGETGLYRDLWLSDERA